MASRITTDAERQLRQARTELEADLRSGVRRRAEQVLEAHPSLAGDPDSALELIYTEYVVREELGESPSFEEWYGRFPALRADLEEVFQVHEVLRQTDRVEALSGAHPPGGPATDVRTPRRIGGYEILEEIGRGGMGVVYRARQVRLNRIVALKVILAGAYAGRKQRERFQREAQAAARFDHPNIVRVFEVGEHDGHPFCAMEYVGGGSLADHLTGAPWAPQAAAELVARLARAVQHAHERGVVHRDLKPANVLLAPVAEGPEAESGESGPGRSGSGGDRRGALVPKIADFGLAKWLEDSEPGPTHTGDLLGTPAYMAPEQANGQVHQFGAVTDVWALGVILYELLTGRSPFTGDSTAETLQQIQRVDPPPPRRVARKLPRDLDTICLKCLEKAPARRYATAAGLAGDLEHWLRGEPIEARSVGPAGRAAKWVRRHPATAGWLGLVVLVTALAFAAVTSYAVHAENRRIEAEQARVTAQRARDEARRALYYQEVGRAYHEWEASNLALAERLLDSAGHKQKGWEWSFVRGLCRSDLLTLPGHPDAVAAVSYSPDGAVLASATGTWGGLRAGEIRTWDARTGRLLRTFGGAIAPVHDLAFRPDGRQLATASVAFSSGLPAGVFLWDAATGAEVGRLKGETSTFSVAYSPDGTRLATGGIAGQVRLWDASTGDLIADLGRHGASGVHDVAFSPDGALLATGGWDGTLRIWDVVARRQKLELKAYSDVRGVAFHPDGRHVAAACFSPAVEVWDITTGELVVTHGHHSSPVRNVTFSPDGVYLASGDNSGLVVVSDAFQPLRLHRSLRGHTGAAYAVSFSPDGARLATGSQDGTVKVWDAVSTQEVRSLVTRGAPSSRCLVYSPDGRHLASAGAATTTAQVTVNDIRVYDVEREALARTLKGHARGVTAVAYSANGQRLASTSLDQTARVWDATNGKLLATLRGHTRAANCVAYHPDSVRFATGGADGTVRIWDAVAGRSVRVLEGHGAPVTAIAYSVDGTLLACATEDGSVWLRNAADYRVIRKLSAHDGPVNGLAFDRGGTWLASGGEDGLVRICEVATGRIRPMDVAHTRPVTGLAFSPDGTRLASSSRDWSVKLWDITAGTDAFTLRGELGEILSVAFRPDGRQLAGGSQYGAQIRVWDVEATREERTALAARRALTWHRSRAGTEERARRWEPALFHLNWLVADRPDDIALRARRARALGELGRYAGVEADYDRVAELNPRNEDAYYYRALLRLVAGDRAGYAALCRRTLERLEGATTGPVANQAAWTCAMAPDAGVEPARIVALAEKAVALAPNASTGLNTLGAALYRAGRYEEAIARLEQSIDVSGDRGSVEDWLFLSMAHRRLGQEAEARGWLERATRFLAATPLLDEAGKPPYWSQPLTWQLLRAEAEGRAAPAAGP